VARLVAGCAAAAVALLHVLIGLGVLVITTGADAGADLRVFGLTAGAGFAVAAVVVAQAQRRLVHALVGALIPPVMIMYVVMADVREPHFEVWGLTIQALQAVLLLALVVLVVRPRQVPSGAPTRGRTGAVSARRSSATPPVPGSAGR